MIGNITKETLLILNEEETRDNVVICVLLNDKDEAALFKRSEDDETNPSLWGLIGGGVDDTDESFVKALEREIKEEAGIKLSGFKFIRTFKRNKTHIHVYTKRVKDIDPTLNKEHSEWGWFPVDELPTPGFGNNKENIELAIEELSGEKESLNESSYLGLNERIVKQYLQSKGLDPDEISYAGSGEFGIAYYVGDDLILKITTSKSEPKLSKVLMNNPQPNLVRILDVMGVSNGKLHLILMERLDVDNDNIEYIFRTIEDDMFEYSGNPINYICSFDFEDEDFLENFPRYKDGDWNDFIEDLCTIFTSYNRLGVSNPDVHPENLGFNSNNELVAFDIHDRDINEESTLTENKKVYRITESQANLIREEIAYHGSPYKFSEFTTEFVKTDSGNHEHGLGIYFTEDPEEPKSYLGENGGGYIYKVDLDLSNFIKEGMEINPDIIYKMVVEGVKHPDYPYNYVEEGDVEGEAQNVTDNFVTYSEDFIDALQYVWHDVYRNNEENYLKNLARLGVDGFIINKDYRDALMYVVTNPDVIQILDVIKP